MMLNYVIIDLMSGAVFALILVWIVLALRRCRSVGRYVMMSILVVYLCEVFNLVGIPGLGYFHWDPNIQLIPFSDEHTRRYLIQLGLNAALFVPFGILVPMIWREFRSWGATTGAGFLTSLLIEGIQLCSFRATDVDDLIMNTLGTFVGYLLAWIFLHGFWKRSQFGKPSRGPGLALTILICLAVMVVIRMPVSTWIYSLIPA